MNRKEGTSNSPTVNMKGNGGSNKTIVAQDRLRKSGKQPRRLIRRKKSRK